ncbi:uncharacterized protein LOC144107707 [Amblyomma americanum]
MLDNNEARKTTEAGGEDNGLIQKKIDVPGLVVTPEATPRLRSLRSVTVVHEAFTSASPCVADKEDSRATLTFLVVFALMLGLSIGGTLAVLFLVHLASRGVSVNGTTSEVQPAEGANASTGGSDASWIGR